MAKRARLWNETILYDEPAPPYSVQAEAVTFTEFPKNFWKRSRGKARSSEAKVDWIDVTNIFPHMPGSIQSEDGKVLVPSVIYVPQVGCLIANPIPDGRYQIDLDYFTPFGEHTDAWIDEAPAATGAQERMLYMTNGEELAAGQWTGIESNFHLPSNSHFAFMLWMSRPPREESSGQPTRKKFQGVVVRFAYDAQSEIRLWFPIEGDMVVYYRHNELTGGQWVAAQTGTAAARFGQRSSSLDTEKARGSVLGTVKMIQVAFLGLGLAITSDYWQSCVVVNLPLQSAESQPPYYWGIPWQAPSSPIQFMGNCGQWGAAFFPIYMPESSYSLTYVDDPEAPTPYTKLEYAGAAFRGPVRRVHYDWANNPNDWEFVTRQQLPTGGENVHILSCFDSSGDPIQGAATVTRDGGTPDTRYRFEWICLMAPAKHEITCDAGTFYTYTSPQLYSVIAMKRAYIVSNSSTWTDVSNNVKRISISAGEDGRITGQLTLDRRAFSDSKAQNWLKYRRRVVNLQAGWADSAGNHITADGAAKLYGFATRPQALQGRGIKAELEFPLMDYISTLAAEGRGIDLPPGDGFQLKWLLEYILESVGIGPDLYTPPFGDVDKGVEDLGIYVPVGDLAAPAFKLSPRSTLMTLIQKLQILGLGARLWQNGEYVTWSCQWCGRKRNNTPGDTHYWYNHVVGGPKSAGCRAWDMERTGTSYLHSNGLYYGIDLEVFLGISHAPLSVQAGVEVLKGDLLGPIERPELTRAEDLYTTVKVYGQTYYLGSRGQRELREYTITLPNWDAIKDSTHPDYIGHEKVYAIGPEAWLRDVRWLRAIGLVEYYKRCFSWPRVAVRVPFWPAANLGKVFIIYCDDTLGLNNTIWRIVSYRHNLDATAGNLASYGSTELVGIKIS